MYGFGGVGLSEVQISISELSVVGGWVGGGGWWTGQTHFMVGPGRGPTKRELKLNRILEPSDLREDDCRPWFGAFKTK